MGIQQVKSVMWLICDTIVWGAAVTDGWRGVAGLVLVITLEMRGGGERVHVVVGHLGHGIGEAPILGREVLRREGWGKIEAHLVWRCKHRVHGASGVAS